MKGHVDVSDPLKTPRMALGGDAVLYGTHSLFGF